MIPFCGARSEMEKALQALDRVLPVSVFTDIRPWNLGIVSEDDQPSFGNRVFVKPVPIIDARNGIEVVSHHPGWMDVRGGWNEIADVARTLAVGFEDHSHVIRGVSRIELHGDSWRDLGIAIEDHSLSVADQRIVVVREITDAVAFMLFVRMREFTFLHVVLCARKRRRNCSITLAKCVPTAMIKVEMRVDDDIDFRRIYPCFVELLHEQHFVSVNRDGLVGQLISDPSLNDDRLVASTHHERVESEPEAIEFVGRHFLVPQNLGHHAEHGSAIQVIAAIGQHRQFEIAQRRFLQQLSPVRTSARCSCTRFGCFIRRAALWSSQSRCRRLSIYLCI